VKVLGTKKQTSTLKENEKDVTKQVLDWVSYHPEITLLRFNTTGIPDKNVKGGLRKNPIAGAPDFIGVYMMAKIPISFYFEIKSPTGKQRDAQKSSNRQSKSKGTTTSSSDLHKTLKRLSEKFTNSTVVESVGHSLDLKIPTVPHGCLEKHEVRKPLYRKFYQQTLRTKHLHLKTESVSEAVYVYNLFKPHLPSDIGITILRETEVNCYHIKIITKELLAEEERLFNVRKKTLMRTMREKGMSPEELKELKNADRRRYFAETKKEPKKKEITKEAKSFRVKRES